MKIEDSMLKSSTQWINLEKSHQNYHNGDLKNQK